MGRVAGAVSGHLLLDTAVLALSFSNMMLLLWLGLTVLLNAERRAWGIWMAAGSLLAGSAFLTIHSSLYAQGLIRVSPGLSLGWFVGWVLAAALPYAWYVVMLWYAGYWDGAASPLHRRHRPWLWLATLGGLALLGLLVVASPFPTYARVVEYELSGNSTLGAMPLIGLSYPLYIVLAIGLSLDVLRRPVPSGRVMGDLARSRARPWLIAASLALLAVSGLVAVVVAWLLLSSRYPLRSEPLDRLAVTVAWFDLAIDGVLGIAILLLGQAVVAYEIFTGKALPRRGLRRHWRMVVVLAAGLGVLLAASLTRLLRPVNGLLLAGGLVTLCYALLARRSFGERELYVGHLRPFITNLRLYEHLLSGAPGTPPEVGLAGPFRALCEDVLGARVAYLAALGPLAPLVGPPVSHPPRPVPPAALQELAALELPAAVLCVPIDPATHGGATWAVPLRSEGKPIGVLLLGPKRDGGLYTQEEIEIARASSERLLDTAASAEMARRLMALQRQRLAESQVLDQQARRILHDEILPRLHAAILALAGGPAETVDPSATLVEVHRRLSDLLRARPPAGAPDLARLGLVGALRQVLRRELEGAFAEVVWQVEPRAEERFRAIPPRFAEVIYYAAREALRNAARHARGDGVRPVRLRIGVSGRDGLQVLVEDDGVGLGGPPADPGTGQGLALHSTMMAVIGGTLAVESLPGQYTRVLLTLPEGAW